MTDPINEIQEFAGGAAADNIFTPVEYAAAPARATGHVPGLADQRLENAVLRQLSRFNRGVAQFIALRHLAGVVDDGDAAKIVAGLEDAIGQIAAALVTAHNGSGTAHADIRAALAGITIPYATEAVAGVIKRSSSAQALAGTDNTTAMSPADVAAAIAGVVRGYTRQQYMAQVSLLAVSGTLVIDLDTQAALSLQIVGGTVIANPEHTGTQKRGRLMLAASAAHSLSWGSAWKSSSTVTLPTATIAGATIVLDYVCIDGTMYPLWMSTLGLVLSNTDIAPVAALSAIGSQNGGHALPYLVDGNNTTLASFSGTLPAFIFDFGSANPRNIWKLRLGLNGGTINPLPVRFVYSDDGNAWVNTNQSAISKTLDSTITDHLVDNFGAHRFWALMPTSGTWIQFTTVELYPRIGG